MGLRLNRATESPAYILIKKYYNLKKYATISGRYRTKSTALYLIKKNRKFFDYSILKKLREEERRGTEEEKNDSTTVGLYIKTQSLLVNSCSQSGNF